MQKIHGIMITNNADFHPADYHAEMTASKIIDLGENATNEQIAAVRDIRKKLEAILTDHHTAVENEEQRLLQNNVTERLLAPLEADDTECLATVDKIIAAMQDTPYAAAFNTPEAREGIHNIIHHESRSQMAIHRDAAMK